jgi:hypothetical protein
MVTLEQQKLTAKKACFNAFEKIARQEGFAEVTPSDLSMLAAVSDHPNAALQTAYAACEVREVAIDACGSMGALLVYWASEFGETEFANAIGSYTYEIAYSGLTGGVLEEGANITTDGGYKSTIKEIGEGTIIFTGIRKETLADNPVADEEFTVDGSSPTISATIESIELL